MFITVVQLVVRMQDRVPYFIYFQQNNVTAKILQFWYLRNLITTLITAFNNPDKLINYLFIFKIIDN